MLDDRPAHRRRRALRFLRAFLASPRSVGAILPSSEGLARAMVRGLHLDDEDTLLELGPGTGALTAHIRSILPCPSRYLGIEREPHFVRILEEQFPDLRFLEGDAAQAGEMVARTGLRRPRVVLSGLPFVSQRREEQDRILRSIAGLVEGGGVFRTFQYVHGYVLPAAVRFRRRAEQIFGVRLVLSPALLANIPPAYVLTWEIPSEVQTMEPAES